MESVSGESMAAQSWTAILYLHHCPARRYNKVSSHLLTCQIYLIDNNGNVVREWAVPYRIGRSARFLPNGNLVVACKDPDAKAPFLFVGRTSGVC